MYLLQFFALCIYFFSRRFVKSLGNLYELQELLNTYLRNHNNNFPTKAMYRIVPECTELVSERKQIITFVITINLAQTGLWEI